MSNKFKYPQIIKTCPVCGESFETQLGARDEKTVCSHSCANTYFRSGKSNPNYKEDDELTGEVKYATICFRYHVHKCVCCTEENIVEAHHYDECKDNNDPCNLVPLCPTHHRYMHSKFKNLIKSQVDEYVITFIKSR